MSVSQASRRVAATPGAQRNVLPLAEAVSIRRFASASVLASGFSEKRCRPASRTALLTSPWRGAGARSMTASRSPSLSMDARSP
jgi:hypothetical protein